MNKEEIQAKYLAQHNALGTRKDASNKDLFDQKHHQVWADCDVELKARKTELESRGNLSPNEQAEIVELESMFPKPALPSRDLVKEIDELKDKVKRLEERS